jgi:hypothetical protein
MGVDLSKFLLNVACNVVHDFIKYAKCKTIKLPLVTMALRYARRRGAFTVKPNWSKIPATETQPRDVGIGMLDGEIDALLRLGGRNASLTPIRKGAKGSILEGGEAQLGGDGGAPQKPLGQGPW